MAEPRRLGGFELHEKLGSGAMATVFRGVQLSLSRAVVLKIIHPHLAEDPSLVQRFEREARSAAHLRHENVVQVIDCGRIDDTSFIAMEFVQGSDLKHIMEMYGTPPLEMAVLMLRDTCKGLQHAHENGVIHRDIKPANIMLTPEGTIKIMDFGLARRAEDSVAMTIQGSVMGTPAYMSPEQATGQRVDERSDIFTLGVMGYELFCGRRPFLGDSYSAVLNAILTQEPEPLKELAPTIPADLAAIIMKMLRKNVDERYQKVAEVRDALEAVIARLGLARGDDFLRRYARSPDDVGRRLRERGPRASVESVLLGTASPPVVETMQPGGGTEATIVGTQTIERTGGAAATVASGGTVAPGGTGTLAAEDAAALAERERQAEQAAREAAARHAADNERAREAERAAADSARDAERRRTEAAERAADAGREAGRVVDGRGTTGGAQAGKRALWIGLGVVGVVVVLAGSTMLLRGLGHEGQPDNLPAVEHQDPPATGGGRGATTGGGTVPETKPPESNPPEVKPPETKHVTVPPVETKPRETKPPVKSPVTPPVERRPAQTVPPRDGGDRPTDTTPSAGRHRFKVSSRPAGEITVDGRRVEFGAVVELKEGSHRIKAVNRALNLTAEFTYEVRAGEANNALIVNFEANQLIARHNPELPF